jgi:glycosyltransferase involved in cell wall biosynthesis
MKVVLLHPPMYPVNHEFYNMLGKKVDLVVFQIGEYPTHHTKWDNESIRKGQFNYKLKIFSKGSITFIKTLNPLILIAIMREKPSIVMSIAFWIPSLYVSILKKFQDFKFLILTNAIFATEQNASRSKQFVQNIIANNTDAFISASDLTSEYLSSKFTNTDIFLSLQTIDVNKWIFDSNALATKKQLIKKLNIPLDKKIMLGVGNYTDKKNWKSILNILPQIDNVHFVLVGHGVQENEYIKIIKDLNIESKVSIIGRKDGDALLEYYKACDFLIFPSNYDQFGFVVPEALSSGLPVLCSKNAGSASLVKEGINGYIIDPSKNNTAKINDLILNIDSLKKNTIAVMNNYTLENRVNEFVQIFLIVIKEDSFGK